MDVLTGKTIRNMEVVIWNPSITSPGQPNFEENSMTLAGTKNDINRVIAIEGLTEVPFQFQTSKNPKGTNVYVNNRVSQPRLIAIKFESDNTREHRSKISSFFNPYESLRVRIAWKGLTRYISCIAYAPKISSDNTYNPYLITDVDLFCYSPFFEGDRESFSNTDNINFSAIKFGDAPTANKITAIATASSEKIEFKFTYRDVWGQPKTTYTYTVAGIAVNIGDVFILNNDPDDLWLTQNGIDISDKLATNSRFFEWYPYVQYFSVYGEEGGEATIEYDYTVEYTPKFLGI